MARSILLFIANWMSPSYNGVTTTCEALWMSVPVVTLRGARHSGRVGASLLTSAGFEEFVASDVEDYVTIAAEVASARGRLSHLRYTLRPRIAASLLCDARRFARNIEAAYFCISREQLCSDMLEEKYYADTFHDEQSILRRSRRI